MLLSLLIVDFLLLKFLFLLAEIIGRISLQRVVIRIWIRFLESKVAFLVQIDNLVRRRRLNFPEKMKISWYFKVVSNGLSYRYCKESEFFTLRDSPSKCAFFIVSYEGMKTLFMWRGYSIVRVWFSVLTFSYENWIF